METEYKILGTGQKVYLTLHLHTKVYFWESYITTQIPIVQ